MSRRPLLLLALVAALAAVATAAPGLAASIGNVLAAYDGMDRVGGQPLSLVDGLMEALYEYDGTFDKEDEEVEPVRKYETFRIKQPDGSWNGRHGPNPLAVWRGTVPPGDVNPVLRLTRVNYHNTVLGDRHSHVDNWIVFFCLDWWQACQNCAAPFFQASVNYAALALADERLLQTAVRFARVDCAKDKFLCVDEDADATPTLLHFRGGKMVNKWMGAGNSKDGDNVTAWIDQALKLAIGGRPSVEAESGATANDAPKPVGKGVGDKNAARTACGRILSEVLAELRVHKVPIFAVAAASLVFGMLLGQIGIRRPHEPAAERLAAVGAARARQALARDVG